MFSVLAKDLDSGINSQIVYVLSDDDDGPFGINALSKCGNVKVFYMVQRYVADFVGFPVVIMRKKYL